MNSGRGKRADWIAPVGTTLAIIARYGPLAAIGLLSLMGISVAVHEGLWAAVIAVLALLALAGLGLGWWRRRVVLPFLTGLLGTSLVLWAMTVSYERSLEIAGFVLLIVAAALDWRDIRNRRRHSHFD